MTHALSRRVARADPSAAPVDDFVGDRHGPLAAAAALEGPTRLGSMVVGCESDYLSPESLAEPCSWGRPSVRRPDTGHRSACDAQL